MCLCLAAIDLEIIKTLILSQKGYYDIVLYYKVDAQSIKQFVNDEIKLDDADFKEFSNDCLGLSSHSLFNGKRQRYETMRAEVLQFKNTPNDGDWKDINAMVCKVDKYFKDSKNEEWISKWNNFKGEPYVFQGLLGALFLKKGIQSLNMQIKMQVFVIHALPRTYGYYMDTWRYEEIELLWLWNCYFEEYEMINCNDWQEFDLWTRLNIHNVSYKYDPKILLQKTRNAACLLKLCLGHSELNWAVTKILSVSELFSNTMVYNIVSLSLILRQEVNEQTHKHTKKKKYINKQTHKQKTHRILMFIGLVLSILI